MMVKLYFAKQNSSLQFYNLTIIQFFNLMNIRHFILLLILVSVSVAQVIACSCRPPLPMTEMEFFNADVVFIGKITSVDANEETYKRTATFKILNALKVAGSAKEVTVVTSYDSAACGLSFNEGDLWYIWANSNGKTFSSNICTRSLRLNEDGTTAVQRYHDDMLAINSFKKQSGKYTFDTDRGTTTGKIRRGLKKGCWKYYDENGVLYKKCKYKKGIVSKCKDVEAKSEAVK